MKFCGIVGYCENVEEKGDRKGNWIDKVTERTYFGDVLRNTRKWEGSRNESTNDDLLINNQFSILADSYAYTHFQTMKYVKWLGACWKITNVEVQRPRLILTVGGVYNGQTATTPAEAGDIV